MICCLDVTVGRGQGGSVAVVILYGAEVSENGWTPGWLGALELPGGSVLRARSNFWNDSRV